MASNPDYPNQSDMISALITEIVKLGGWIKFTEEGHLLESALGDKFHLTPKQKQRIDPQCNAQGKRAWRNHIQFVRLKARDRELLDCSKRNIWKVTEQGYTSIANHFSDNKIEVAYKNQFGKNINSEPLVSSPEGLEMYKLHRSYERDSLFIRLAKQRYLNGNPRMNCEACGFSFLEYYGKRGEGYIEAHHNIPISEKKAPSKTHFGDISFLCSNCHNIIHRTKPWMSVEELVRLIKSNKMNSLYKNGRAHF